MAAAFKSRKMKITSLILFSFLVGVCLATCGCGGTNQVYVLYKPPVTGWYEYYEKKSCFRRVLSVKINDGPVEYFLRKGQRDTWLLLEKSTRKRGYTTIVAFRENTEDIKVTCPPPTCECVRVDVKGVDYFAGKYYKIDLLEEELKKAWDIEQAFLNDTSNNLRTPPYVRTVFKRPTTSKLAEIPLANLSACIKREKKVSAMYKNASTMTKSEVYIREDRLFNLTRAPEGDFWWITTEDEVHATSKQGAPCLDDLPKQNWWEVIKENQIFCPDQNMTVECFTYT